jgi:hypothetical protein
MAAARRAVDAEFRGLAVPGRGIRLEPAHGVVGVLNTGRIGRFRRERHVDRDHQQTARGESAVHRLFGETLLAVPRAAMEIENGRERPLSFRLVDPRHQHPTGAVTSQLDLADDEIEVGRGIIGRRTRRARGDRPEQERVGEADRARRRRLQDLAPSETVYCQSRRLQSGSTIDSSVSPAASVWEAVATRVPAERMRRSECPSQQHS